MFTIASKACAALFITLAAATAHAAPTAPSYIFPVGTLMEALASLLR
jgi:hypothetical protein